jgi:multidrug resistance protein, MATE family
MTQPAPPSLSAALPAIIDTSEWRRIATHAATVWLGQVAVMAYGVIDTVVAGRHSEAALAALSVGAAIYISVYVSLLGIVQSLLPIYAEHFGAGQKTEVGKAFRQALYLGCMVLVAGVSILLHSQILLEWGGVPQAMQGGVMDYLQIAAWSFAPSLLFRMFSSLNQALGHPRLITFLQLCSVSLKLPLSVLLALGTGDWAGMGLVGCAWASLLINTSLALVALLMLWRHPMYRPFAVWHSIERPDWRRIGRFAQLGLPSGLATMVEITSFTLMSVFIARMGNTAAAAHQIAANSAAVLFMAPLSFGIAGSARVSYWLGAAQTVQAYRAAKTSVALALGTALGMSFLLWMFSQHIASSYTAQPQVVALAAGLLGWVAVYHVLDAVQGVCAFLLRCYKITLRPLLVYVFWLWGLGLAGGHWLTYQTDTSAWWGWAESFMPLARLATSLGISHNPSGFWLAADVATAVVALCFVWMLHRAAQPNNSALRCLRG